MDRSDYDSQAGPSDENDAQSTPHAERPYRPSDVFRCEHSSYTIEGGRLQCFVCGATWVRAWVRV